MSSREQHPLWEVGLQCPNCGGDVHRVLDSRKQMGSTQRQRECHHCGTRFITREVVERTTRSRTRRPGGTSV